MQTVALQVRPVRALRLCWGGSDRVGERPFVRTCHSHLSEGTKHRLRPIRPQVLAYTENCKLCDLLLKERGSCGERLWDCCRQVKNSECRQSKSRPSKTAKTGAASVLMIVGGKAWAACRLSRRCTHRNRINKA